MGDRCLTSIKIIDTFWNTPEMIGICNGINYENGVNIGHELNLPIILYSNERYDDVMDSIKRWNCEVILLDEIEVLIKAFEFKELQYSYELPEKIEYENIENTYIYYDKYDTSILEEMVSEYLYLSKEAQTDFPNLESHCDETTLIKIYDTDDTGYYYKIKI